MLSETEGKARVNELTCQHGTLAETMDDEWSGERGGSVGRGDEVGSGLGNYFTPASYTMDDNGFVHTMSRLQCGAEGCQLHVHRSRTQTVKPTFANGYEMRICMVSVNCLKKEVDAVVVEMPWMEFDAVELLLVGRECEVATCHILDLVGGDGEDGMATARRVGMYVGECVEHVVKINTL